jgi:glycosyltransferase involved in cell wall biosynthesis
MTYENSPAETVSKIREFTREEVNRHQAAKKAENHFSWQKVARKLLGHFVNSAN